MRVAPSPRRLPGPRGLPAPPLVAARPELRLFRSLIVKGFDLQLTPGQDFLSANPALFKHKNTLPSSLASVILIPRRLTPRAAPEPRLHPSELGADARAAGSKAVPRDPSRGDVAEGMGDAPPGTCRPLPPARPPRTRSESPGPPPGRAGRAQAAGGGRPRRAETKARPGAQRRTAEVTEPAGEAERGERRGWRTGREGSAGGRRESGEREERRGPGSRPLLALNRQPSRRGATAGSREARPPPPGGDRDPRAVRRAPPAADAAASRGRAERGPGGRAAGEEGPRGRGAAGRGRGHSSAPPAGPRRRPGGGGPRPGAGARARGPRVPLLRGPASERAPTRRPSRGPRAAPTLRD